MAGYGRTLHSPALPLWMTKGQIWIAALTGLAAGILAPVGNAVDLYQKLDHKPPARSADLSTRVYHGLIPNVTWGSFITEIQGTVPQNVLTKQENDWKPIYNGVILDLHVTINGYDGVWCPIYWTVINDASGEAVHNVTLINQPGFPTSGVTPSDDNFQAPLEIWVPTPGRPGVYRIKIRLYHDHALFQDQLDYLETPAFEVDIRHGVNTVTVINNS